MVPFWAKRGEAAHRRKFLERHIRALKEDKVTCDARICIYHLEVTKLFSNLTSIDTISTGLSATLETVRVDSRPAPHQPTEDDVGEVGAHEDLGLSPDRKSVRQLPIVFIAHSLGSWVVKDLLSNYRHNNTSLVFDTRGVVFLDTPVETVKESDLETYLASLNSFLENRLPKRAGIEKLVDELKTIDNNFKITQGSPFIREAKGHLRSTQSITTQHGFIWAGAETNAGLLVFKEASENDRPLAHESFKGRDGKQKKYGLRGLLKRFKDGRATLQRSKIGLDLETFDPLQSGALKSELGGLLADLLEDHYRQHPPQLVPEESSNQVHNTKLLHRTHDHQNQSFLTLEQSAPRTLGPRLETSISAESKSLPTRPTSPVSVKDFALLTGVREVPYSTVEQRQLVDKATRSFTAGLLSHNRSISTPKAQRRDSTDSKPRDSLTSISTMLSQPLILKSIAENSDFSYPKAWKETLALANSYYQRADFPNACVAFRRCKKILPEVRDLNSAMNHGLIEIALDEQLAAIFLYRGLCSEAYSEFQRLLDKARQLSQTPEGRTERLIRDLQRWTAVVLLHQGKYEEAAVEFRDLLEQSNKHGDHPQAWRLFRMQVQRDLGLAVAHLGPYLKACQHIQAAKQELEEYLLIPAGVSQSAETLAKEDLPEPSVASTVGSSTANPADSLTANKDDTDTSRKFQVKRDHLGFIEATIYSLWGFHMKALEISEKALRGLNQNLGERHLKTLECASLNALLLANNSQPLQAERSCTQTLQNMKRELGPKHPLTLEATGRLVYILKLQYRLSEAATTALSLQKLTQETYDAQHPQALQSRLILYDVQAVAGDYFAAVEGLHELVKASASEKMGLLTALVQKSAYARALYQAGALHQAEELSISTLREQRRESFLSTRSKDSLQRTESSSHLINVTVEAIDQDADDLRISPSVLFTLETIALSIANKPKPDLSLASKILDCCWRRQRDVMGHNHAFTLASRFELALTFQGEPGGDGKAIETRARHLKHVYLRRMTILEDTHPDVLTARRELIITMCELGRWSDLPYSANASNFEQYSNATEGVSEDTSKEFDDMTWDLVESESMRILSMHEMQLGETHPETLKSHLWIFTLQIFFGGDVLDETCMNELIHRLTNPRVLSQRLVQSVQMMHQMASLLLRNGHPLAALSILHRIPAKMASPPRSRDLSEVFDMIFKGLGKRTDQMTLDATRSAQAIFKPELDKLRGDIKNAVQRHANYEEIRKGFTRVISLCELMYGAANPQTLNARKDFATLAWESDSGDGMRMREAISMMQEVLMILRKTFNEVEMKNVAMIHDSWVEELERKIEEQDEG